MTGSKFEDKQRRGLRGSRLRVGVYRCELSGGFRV